MGQYLAIGLPYQIFISPARAIDQAASLDEVREGMGRSLYYDMSLFEGEEREKTQVFTIKNELLQEGLLPFLEDFYPKMYVDPDMSGQGYTQALETLRSTPFDQWLDFARTKRNYVFQWDDCAELQYFDVQKPYGPKACLRSHCFLLYLGYGKVITEGISDFTNFFKFCFHEAFSKHPIAKAVRIYITG